MPETMESNQRGEDIGKAVAASARASLSAGLEYGSRDKYAHRTDEYAAAQAKEAISELSGAGEPLMSLALMYIELLKRSNSIADDDRVELTAEFRVKWLRGLTDCFRVGLEYSTQL